MAGALSKRQQARNERVLQELIKTVPGNNICADCQARNPGWASWSLGIFLCMRCAALHRKLGTHITKVKSLSMDSWSNEQVEHMKRLGNTASNRIYNPQNTKPPIPFDVDDADSAFERFIRQKYVERSVNAPARHNTGSTNSDDQPPPLPPKTGSRFGFRSASSIFPLSSKSKREAAARQVFDAEREKTPSPKRNKQSRVFGAAVGEYGNEDFEAKMAKLRDMGFADEKRNLAVLKGLGGNLEKSIETLVRLGEGNAPVAPAKNPESIGSSSKSRTPASAGLSINRTPVESSPSSNNPFDMLDKPAPIVQPQSSQSTGGLAQGQVMGNNPYQQPQNSNPFGLQPSQSQYNLNQAFQNMSVGPSQPLFPNHTGGFPGPQPPLQQLYQQSMTPPVPSMPQRYYPSVIYGNPAQQPPQPPQSYNPFMQQAQQPAQVPPINTNIPSNPYLQQQMTPQSLYQSPMAQSPAQQFPSSVFDHAVQPAQQMNPYFTQNNAQPQPQSQANPFFNQTNAQQQPQAQPPQQNFDYSQQQPHYQQIRQQTHPIMPQQTGRADKRSILDLYNYPQLAPSQPQQFDQIQAQNQNPEVQTFAPQHQQRSISSPATSPGPGGSNNPFASGLASPTEAVVYGNGNGNGMVKGNAARHVSQESMSVNDASGWMNGRHSPDAFGSLSARHMR